MLPAIGAPELIIVAVIAIIIFGPSKLPDLGRSLGKSFREFRSATDEITEIKDSVTGSVDDLKKSVAVDVNLDSTKKKA